MYTPTGYVAEYQEINGKRASLCTPFEAARHFADTYFAEPRKVRSERNARPLEIVFDLVNGRRTYGARFDDRGQSYIIFDADAPGAM